MSASRRIRQGLPRVPGGEPWPPLSAEQRAQAAADASGVPAVADSASVTGEQAVTPPPAVSPQPDPVAATPGDEVRLAAAAVAEPASASAGPIRRGLPRVPGGDPWPPETVVAASTGPRPAPVASREAASVPAQAGISAAGPVVSPQAESETPSPTVPDRDVRRGLPRVAGGEPWPDATALAALASARQAQAAPQETPAAQEPPVVAAQTSAITPAEEPAAPLQPLPFEPTAWRGAAAAATAPAAAPVVAVRAPKRAAESDAGSRPRLRPLQLISLGFLGLAGLFIAAAGVFLVRWLLSLSGMQEFLIAYPGEYHLPEWAEQGFPAWVRWQHFFNVFLMVLIIRSGLQIRHEKRPTVFWTPPWSKKGRGKISLAIWFHQSLDALWLINGIVFVVLLFVTGHWVRIVPTSWEVFPNALSALLQYVSLDWPTENGWANYNSLQQLAYFTTVFIAAPLAAITGIRMSSFWPKKAQRLNKLYPVEWARAVHFPVMLYFVAFIVMHVALVFATGMLRNLNHMYTGTDVVNWTGFWIFLGSMAVIAGAWVAARPVILAQIAALTGTVKR